MAGANAFVFDGGAFVPSDPTSTATINAYKASSDEFAGISIVKNVATGAQIWAGYPPVPSISSVTNTPTGTFPNKESNVTVQWTIDANTIVDHFDVYVSVNGGPHAKHNSSPIASNVTSYVYGAVSADIPYSFQVVAVGISGLSTTSSLSSITVASPAALTTLSVVGASTTDTSLTWQWTVPANTYQSYEVQRSSNNSTWTTVAVSGTEAGTTFSSEWTGRTENTNYWLRVRAKNNNSHWTPYSSSVQGTTDNTPPTVGTISVSALSVTTDYATAAAAGITTTSTSVNRTWRVVVNPSNDLDYFKTELYKSNIGSPYSWTLIKTWQAAEGTGQQQYDYIETITSSAETKYFKTIQYDTYLDTVESSVVSATSVTRRSNVVTTYSAGPAITTTKNGGELNILYSGAEGNRSPSGTYGWAKTYDMSSGSPNLNSAWISQNTDQPTYGFWGFNIAPDAGYSELYSCTINYYEFISYNTQPNVFFQLYDDYNLKWHGSAVEPTGVNGYKYVAYIGSGLGNQNTYNRGTMNISANFGLTGRSYIYWDCRVILRNSPFDWNLGQYVYGIFNFRVNYTYRNLVVTNTTWYW